MWSGEAAATSVSSVVVQGDFAVGQRCENIYKRVLHNLCMHLINQNDRVCNINQPLDRSGLIFCVVCLVTLGIFFRFSLCEARLVSCAVWNSKHYITVVVWFAVSILSLKDFSWFELCWCENHCDDASSRNKIEMKKLVIPLINVIVAISKWCEIESL